MTATARTESTLSQPEPAAEVVRRLRATFNSGVTRGLDWRIDQLQRLRALLVENESELIDALWADLRKNAAEAKTQEIDFTVGDIDEALANLESWLEPRPVEVPDHFGPATTAYTKYDPLGVVLLISPWNFPVHLVIDPIIGALAAGNTVVVKPSEISVHTSALISRLLRRYFDAGVLAVVEGGAEETTALLEQRFDQIFYTGNGTVGRTIMAAAAKNLTPVTLELGGKSPVFVAPDADVEETAKRLVGSKFSNAGQQCIAPDYVLTDPTTAATLVPALRAAVETQFGSAPQTSADFGRIINERHFDRLTRLLDSGRAAVGGQHDREDLFVAPTVLIDVDPASPVMQEEIFGPILAIVEVADLDAAIDFINEREKPLALYAFTASETTKSRLVNETSSGGVAWGQPAMQLLMPGLPFGGVGESGTGQYHGRYSLEAFSHIKGVADVPLGSSAPSLFSPVSLGAIELANRIVMAPLTRVRAGAAGIPGDLMVEYYGQRASVGMIITEGTYPDHGSQGWVGAPGIATDEQAAGWRRVTKAIHDEGGRVVMQIMHAGRAAHPDINGGRRVMAPSAIAIQGTVFTEQGEQPYPVPEAMTTAEAQIALEDFVAAARRAIGAGADGVELHAANGYLLHQFLSPAANQRTDRYGGSPQNRARFVVDVVTAVAKAIGADRVGLRISPEISIGDVFETDRDDVLATYTALVDQLRPLGLAYLSVLHTEPGGELVQELRRRFAGRLLVNSGFLGGQTTREDAMRRITDDHADAVVVGRALIANPDLVHRWRNGHPENVPRPEHFYAPSAEGYTDYPFHRAD